MVDKNTIVEVIAYIKSCFPYFGNGVSPEILVNTWTALLNSYSDREVKEGVFRALQSCKTPPAPANIIEKITEARRASEKSEEELWGTYHESLIRGNRLYHDFPLSFVEENGLSQGENARIAFSDLFRSLPWQIQAYLATESEFKEKARNLDREEIAFERNRFFKALSTLEKRKEFQEQPLPDSAEQEAMQTMAVLQSLSVTS